LRVSGDAGDSGDASAAMRADQPPTEAVEKIGGELLGGKRGKECGGEKYSRESAETE
jgi:hypothetical protein